MNRTNTFLLACVMTCGLNAADMNPSQAFADTLLGHGSQLRTALLEEFMSNGAADDFEFLGIADDAIPTQDAFVAEIDELKNALAACGDDVSKAFDVLTAYVHTGMQAGGYWKALRNYHEDGVPAPFGGDPEEGGLIARHLDLSKVMIILELCFLDPLTLNIYLEHLVPAELRVFFTSTIGPDTFPSLFELHAVITHIKNLRDAGIVITQEMVSDSFKNVHDDYMCNALDGSDDAMLAQWDIEALVPWTHVVPAGAGA